MKIYQIGQYVKTNPNSETTKNNANSFTTKDYEKNRDFGLRQNKPKQTQFQRANCKGMNNQSSIEPFADFHALRHSFCTHVIKSGATVKEAQTLARHNTSALTLDVYSHIGLYDIRRAVERLPQINIDGKDTNESQAATLKTGTDNKSVDAVQNGSEKWTPKWTPFLTPTAFSGCNRSATVGNEQGNFQKNNENDNCLNSGDLDKESNRLAAVGIGGNEKPTDGFEPSTPGLQNQSSTIELRWHNCFSSFKRTLHIKTQYCKKISGRF